MKDIMNTLESSPKFQLVGSLANSSKDLEGTHEPLTKFALTGQVKVLGAQQHVVSNCMLLRPVMLVEVPLLVALGSPHMLLGFLHKLGNVSGKGGSFMVAAFNPHNKIKW